MYFSQLHINNFKNIPQTEIVFGDRFNYIVGQNGMGKTNLLDAIFFVAMGKSYFQSKDKLLIKHEEDFFRLVALIEEVEEQVKYISTLGLNRSKHIERNGIKYAQLADHLGKVPIVFITPTDAYVLFLASQERRKFLDRTISQTNPTYLRSLIQYNKILKQRNALLKKGEYSTIHELLDTYDLQMAPLAKAICDIRKNFMDYMSPIVTSHYHDISKGKEQVELVYQSQLLKNDFLTLSGQNRQRDLATYRTSTGIHKDDFEVSIDGYEIKKFSSQGQMKSFVLGLKLAQHQYLRLKLNKLPILLIDDVFAKLDEQRVKALLKLLSSDKYGQIFITDTSIDRMNAMKENFVTDFSCYQITEGKITAIDEK